MDGILDCADPNQLALLSVLVAIALADGLTTDEIFALAGFIVIVGDSLAAIGAQRTLLESNNAGA